MSIVIVLGLIGVFMPEQPGLWEADGNFDAANVAWMITATIFVLMMTPGLSFFYGGRTEKRNLDNSAEFYSYGHNQCVVGGVRVQLGIRRRCGRIYRQPGDFLYV